MDMKVAVIGSNSFSASNFINFVENTHQIWLLTIVDLLIGSREYSA